MIIIVILLYSHNIIKMDRFRKSDKNNGKIIAYLNVRQFLAKWLYINNIDS